MKESKRKILHIASVVGLCSLTISVAIAIIMLMLPATAGEIYYPEQRDIQNYDLVMEGSTYTDSDSLCVGSANQNLLFAYSSYSSERLIVIDAFDPEFSVIDEELGRVTIDYDAYEYSNIITLEPSSLFWFYTYNITFTFEGYEFRVFGYTSSNYFECVCLDAFDGRNFRVAVDALGIEDISVINSNEYVLDICEKSFYDINGNLPTITQDEVLDTACEWSGYDFYCLGKDMGEIVGMNDNLVFVNSYDTSADEYKTLIVTGMLRSPSYYTVDDDSLRVTIKTKALQQGCYIKSVEEIYDSGIEVNIGGDVYTLDDWDIYEDPDYWTVENQRTYRSHILYANANMVTNLICSSSDGSIVSLEINQEMFAGYNGIVLQGYSTEVLGVIICLFYYAALTLVIILMCKTSPKRKPSKGNMLTLSIITPILLIAMLVGLLCIPDTRIFGIIFAAPLLISVALFITGACVGNVFLQKPKPIIRSPAVMREYALDDEIKALCKYYKDGLLTKEQLKNTIIKKIRAEYDN